MWNDIFFLSEKKCIPDFGQGMFFIKMFYKTERISRPKTRWFLKWFRNVLYVTLWFIAYSISCYWWCICLVAENLFFCLTHFFETYELKGYVINSDWSYVWIANVKYYILESTCDYDVVKWFSQFWDMKWFSMRPTILVTLDE